MKYSVAIFDLDGTILNTLDDLAAAINHVLAVHGMPVHETEKVKYMVGNGIAKLVERAVPGGRENPEYKAVYDEFVEYYRSHSALKTGPYEGMVECLRFLRKAGVKTGVNTNKDEVAAVTLCQKYFPGLFDFVSGGKDSIPVKPAPDGVYQLLGKWGLSPLDDNIKAQTVFIGDSDVDIQTGINAGIDAIGVEWGFRGKDFLLEHGAKTTVSTPDELAVLILNS
ncbi:MAG: HAD family hydrolase [Treponema sp.]|nr:HAD family hydrolase [Treponema sp.]